MVTYSVFYLGMKGLFIIIIIIFFFQKKYVWWRSETQRFRFVNRVDKVDGHPVRKKAWRELTSRWVAHRQGYDIPSSGYGGLNSKGRTAC